MPVKKPQRFYVYRGQLFFVYWTKYNKWKHPHQPGEMECWDEWAVHVGFKAAGEPFFSAHAIEYGGLKARHVTLFGIQFGMTFGYTEANTLNPTVAPPNETL